MTDNTPRDGDAKQGEHWSDCAVNRAPAYEPGPCDCGGFYSPIVTPRDSAGRWRDLDKLADELRMVAFPGAQSWQGASEQTREVWRRVALLVTARIEREVDRALREATAKAHELGQHAAAKTIREMRSARGRDDAS
jgi:hypothetical protein